MHRHRDAQAAAPDGRNQRHQNGRPLVPVDGVPAEIVGRSARGVVDGVEAGPAAAAVPHGLDRRLGVSAGGVEYGKTFVAYD